MTDCRLRRLEQRTVRIRRDLEIEWILTELCQSRPVAWSILGRILRDDDEPVATDRALVEVDSHVLVRRYKCKWRVRSQHASCVVSSRGEIRRRGIGTAINV